jgi:hypothetical protein
MELGEVIGVAGVILGIAWLVCRPQLRYVSLVAALVATAAVETTLVLASRFANEPTSWWSLIAYYPLAVLAIGGWGILLSGFGSLAIGVPGVRFRIASSAAAYLICGALAGAGFVAVLVLTRSGGSGNYLFGTKPLLLAGVAAGLAGGAACLLWQLVATASHPYAWRTRP